MMQYVTQLAQSAQVRHPQSDNAFGEISDQYDDSTAQNMQAMVGQYGGTADTTALKTIFTYNTLGKLPSKTDPRSRSELSPYITPSYGTLQSIESM